MLATSAANANAADTTLILFPTVFLPLEARRSAQT